VSLAPVPEAPEV